MKNLNHWRAIWIFVLKVCLSRAAVTVFKLPLLQDFGVLTRSFGLEITNSTTFNNVGIFNANISNIELLNCTGKIEVVKLCNRTFAEFVRSTSPQEQERLNGVGTSCPYARYECLQDQVNKNELLQTWIQKLKSTVKTLCKNNCWQTLHLIEHQCKPTGKEVSELNGLNFLLELMDTLCKEPTEVGASCASKFLNGLSKTRKTHQPCNITDYIVNKKCSTACDEEITKLYDTMGCCMHLVTTVLEKYRNLLANNSFGVLVATSAQRCHKNYKTCPQQDIHAATTPITKTINSKNSSAVRSTAPITPTVIATSNSTDIHAATTPTTKTVNSNNSSAVRSTTPITPTVNATSNSTIVISTPTGSSKESSTSTTLIAGVCVAVIVSLFVIAIAIRCVYHRIQNKQKLRFEDYGYSQLKMMEDELYNIGGDEEHDGLISF